MAEDPKVSRYHQWLAGKHLIEENVNKDREKNWEQVLQEIVPSEATNVFNINPEFQDRFDELYLIYSKTDRGQY